MLICKMGIIIVLIFYAGERFLEKDLVCGLRIMGVGIDMIL